MLGRAVTEAWKQANARQQYYKATADGNHRLASTISANGLTLDEACRILNVPPPQGGKANMELVVERFKRLFDSNDPTKGGSFYLQSKILRARERIESEVRQAAEVAEKEAELKKPWHPKVWKS